MSSAGISTNNSKAFALGIGLNVVFVIVEIFFGLKADSTALLADAGHNFGDVLSLIFAWSAEVLARRKPSGKFTYGLRRTTILVSLLNALLLFTAMGIIACEAILKFNDPAEIHGTTMIWVAGLGVLINSLTALLFMKGSRKDLNIRGAFLHMAADAGVSLGVVIGGILIFYTSWVSIDPILSLIIVIIVSVGTWNLFSDSLRLALDAVPKNIDLEAVRRYLENIEGVTDVHHLHIWAMSTTENALTVHLVIPKGAGDEVLREIKSELKNKYGIEHTTIQIEHDLGGGI